MSSFTEHELDPAVGLPEGLPEGEFLRWQGKPVWLDLATTVFHVRKIAIYFSALLLLRAFILLGEGLPAGEIASSTLSFVVLAIVALGVLCLLGWLTARACRYTITNRRVVIRSGVALPVTVNLPFSRIVSADYRERRDGCGDIVLTMNDSERPSWMILWPFVRPWSVAKVRPMLRALPESARVAEIIRDALVDFSKTGTEEDMTPRIRPVSDSKKPSAHEFSAISGSGVA
ncbi:MAG TPA: photosynthetic complex putative assembly protein PuhB [Xanthomonadales bacterium]|nr:photosynthetic complex putative assembly protein PuhB [Xanthomonadales bacterium]